MVGDILRIEWEDANLKTGWEPVGEGDKASLQKVTSVGYEINRSNSLVAIATSVTPEGDYNGRLTIPRRCITSIGKMEVVKEEEIDTRDS
jgi:hypothetical protein